MQTMTLDKKTAARVRPDSAEAREDAAYDAWFRAQVQEALDDPGPDIPGEVVEAKMAARRAAALRRIETEDL